MFGMVGGVILRVYGDVCCVMMVIFLGGVVNGVFDLILIFGLGFDLIGVVFVFVVV